MTAVWMKYPTEGATMQQLQAMTMILGYQLVFHDGGVRGLTHFQECTVSVRRDLREGSARATYMHELMHVLRGPVPTAKYDQEELEVERLAALLLVPDLADPSWSDDRLAKHHSVDTKIIAARRVAEPARPWPGREPEVPMRLRQPLADSER